MARVLKTKRMRLPLGVAYVQFVVKGRTFALIAQGCTGTRAGIARRAAAEIARRGHNLVIVTDAELDGC